MIDPLTERIVTLAKAAEVCPPRRAGKNTHKSCVYRWTTVGCRGVRLESIAIGATRCTSLEALVRFFERLTCAQSGDPPPIRTSAQRQRDTKRANDKLKAEGI